MALVYRLVVRNEIASASSPNDPGRAFDSYFRRIVVWAYHAPHHRCELPTNSQQGRSPVQPRLTCVEQKSPVTFLQVDDSADAAVLLRSIAISLQELASGHPPLTPDCHG